MYVVYVWTGWWLISLVLVLVTIKGYYYYYYLMRASQRQQKQANRRRRIGPSRRQGQRVWLSTKDLPLHLESRKLGPRFIGPFKILRKINPVSYRLLLPRSMRSTLLFTFHVWSLLFALLCPQPRSPPHYPRLLVGSQYTLSVDCWILARSVEGSNT